MPHIIAILFTACGLAAVLGSPAKIAAFRRGPSLPERTELDDLHRTTFVKTRNDA